MTSTKNVFCFLAINLLLMACVEPKNKPNDTVDNSKRAVQRYGMVTGLKPEKMAYYKELHADVWPAVQKKISECNIQNYSIYLKEINGSLMLFSYFEYTGNDFDADMKKMAADSATQRWWKETDPCQQPLPDAASKNQIWSSMEEVFHQD
jgi:L-rhamnose mutarotase